MLLALWFSSSLWARSPSDDGNEGVQHALWIFFDGPGLGMASEGLSSRWLLLHNVFVCLLAAEHGSSLWIGFRRDHESLLDEEYE